MSMPPARSASHRRNTTCLQQASRSSRRVSRPAPLERVADRHDRAGHGHRTARHFGQYRLPCHHPRIRTHDRRHPVGGDLLRPDLRQPPAGARAHRRHHRSRDRLPGRPDLQRGGVASRQLCAQLRRDAGVSLPAGHRRGTGDELRRGTGDVALWRRATQPGARHLHDDDGIGLDARSPARRHLDGDLGLAGGVLVPNSDRDRGTVAVARPARGAAAPDKRSL